MNRHLFFVFLAFIGCRNFNHDEEVLCKNEQFLLGSFDDIPLVNTEVNFLRDSVDNPLDSVFDDQGASIQYRFNHNYRGQDLTIRMRSFDFSRIEDYIPPPFNPYHNGRHIYIQKSDTILYAWEPIKIDSINSAVQYWYTSKSPDKYDRVNFYLYWDEGAKDSVIQNVVSEVVDGYVLFANEYSIRKFEENLCSLNDDQINLISKELPFKLKTDFFGSKRMDTWDFLPNLPTTLE